MMQKRKLGTTEVSPLGIGAMSFGPFYGPTTEERCFEVLDAAMELGITHIDTSNVYSGGWSEEVIGKYLAARPGAKEHFVIGTKASITKDADGNRCYRNDAEHLEAELDKSLKRLGLEQVELFYAHRRQADMPVEEAAEALGSLVAKGKCRSIGMSEIAPSTFRRASAAYPVAAVQSEYSLASRAPELGLLQATAELGAALVAFCPVGRSFLTDNPIRPEQVEEIGGFIASNPRFEPENHRRNLEITDGFRKLAAEMGEPAAGVAIAWLLAQGDHVIPIPGTRSAEHFRELARGTELALGESELAAIAEVLPVGWAHGDRYSVGQWVGPERYC